MAIEVSTFAQFLELATGTEDLELVADLDAEVEGYDVVNTFQIKCNLNGNGHSISNVNIQGNYAIYSTTNKTITDVNFHNWKCTSTSSTEVQGIRGAVCEHCQFSMQLSTNHGIWKVIAASSVLNWCSLDITVKNGETVTNFEGSFHYCNIVLRGGGFVPQLASMSIGTLDTSALVLVGCTVGGSGKTINVAGKNGYIALQDCTVNGGTFANSSNSHLFCGSGVTLSGFQQVTAEQLRNKTFLENLGFLP